MTYHLTGVTKLEIKNYPKAVLKELGKVPDLKVGSWIMSVIQEGDIRLKEGFTPVKAGNYRLDFGDTYWGKSPKYAYQHPTAGFEFVTLLQYLRLVQEYPGILRENYYLDFAVDELRNGRGWPYCPCVGQDEDEAWLYDGDADDAFEYYGSFLCAGESTGNLAFETLDNSNYLVFGGKRYSLTPQP